MSETPEWALTHERSPECGDVGSESEPADGLGIARSAAEAPRDGRDRGSARGIGYVYLIQEDGTDRYKIGKSKRPGIRLTTLASVHGKRLTLLHTIGSVAPEWLERRLHRHFASQCAGGEWFRLSVEDVAMVCSMERCDAVFDLPAHLQKDTHEPAGKWDVSAQGPSGFGRKMKTIREDAGMTQSALARRVGCSQGNLVLIERGKHEPSWPLALAIARALGVSVAVFDTNGRPEMEDGET